jgi:hypothetical protein
MPSSSLYHNCCPLEGGEVAELGMIAKIDRALNSNRRIRLVFSKFVKATHL